MKSLFNKNNTGSSELKSLLGFIDVDVSYKNMKMDLNQATKEVRELVGKQVIDKAYDLCLKEELSEAEEEYLQTVRLPIAIRGYALYVPNSDISHTNNGRRMRFDDTEKQAFEWLLDRDNEALERKYYRALDNLIDYLEENDSDWKSSEAYTAIHKSLFPTTSDFNEFFSLNSRLLLMKIIPGVNQCVKKEIRARVPEEMYQNLLSDKSEIPDDILHEIKASAAYYALAWAMPRLSINMFSEGVLQMYVSETQTTQAKKVPENNEIAWAKQAFMQDYQMHIVELEALVKKITTNQNDDDDCFEIDSDAIIGKNYIST